MSIETIADSKLMIGENLPVCQVEISAGGLGDPTELIVQGTAALHPLAMSRWIPKTAGGYMCCYLNASNQLVTGTSSDLDFLDTDDAIESEATQASITTQLSDDNILDICRLSNGTALLLIHDHRDDGSGLFSQVKCYKSASGNGGDWALLATVYTGGLTGSIISDSEELQVIVGSDGRIFLSVSALTLSGSGIRNSYGHLYTSDDKGVTWTQRALIGANTNRCRGVGQVAFMPDRLWWTVTRINIVELYKSTDNGDTWAYVSNISSGTFDTLTSGQVQGASFYYEPTAAVALAHISYPFDALEDGGLFLIESPTTAELDDLTNFTRKSTITSMGSGVSNSGRMYSIGGKLAVQIGQNSAQRIYTLAQESTALQGVTAAAANHKQGAAASASVVLDNPGGVYSYDGAANTHLVGPNKEVTIYMGYGAAREKVFYGLIDKINARSFPQKLAFNCRDMGKKALDGSITNATDQHTVTFADEQAEAIFTTLGTWAGFADIRVEVSGVTIDSKTWNWAKYVDAFNWLCDMTGFDWHVDNDGVLWFKKRATNVPRSEDEEHVLVLDEGEYKGTLDHHPILEGSYTIKNAAEDVTYTKDTDYTLDLATGDIVSVAGGALAAGGTIHPKYTYPRHVFQEGVNLTVLEGYTIDDKPLYYKIFAFGKDSTGALISATWTMTTNTYNVLESKHRKINIDGAVTQEQLQAIVDRAGDDMLRTARVCKCKVVGMPTLQSGDCVQIVESSTTISEIYRVTELSHKFSSSGEPLSTTFTTYHYGYAPIVEGGS